MTGGVGRTVLGFGAARMAGRTFLAMVAALCSRNGDGDRGEPTQTREKRGEQKGRSG